MKPVYQCVCHGVMFFEMKNIIDESKLKSIEELQAKKACAQSCKFCVPYINKLFETGETSFDVIKLDVLDKN